MDLDFSFALVSSLTPRSQKLRTPLHESNSLSSKSLKHNHSQSVPSNPHCSKPPCQKVKENKENCFSKKQLMKNYESCKSNNSYTCNNSCKTKHDYQDDADNHGSSFSVDMINVAVRKPRSRNKKIAKYSPDNCDRKLEIENPHNKPPSKELFCPVLNHGDKQDRVSSEVSRVPSESYSDTNRGSHVNKKASKRKSPRLNKLSEDLLVVDETQCSEMKHILGNTIDSFNRDQSLAKQNVEANSPEVNKTAETSLSSAYDSDFQVTRRGVKTIPETPETDESFTTENKQFSSENCTAKKCTEQKINISIDNSSTRTRRGKTNITCLPVEVTQSTNSCNNVESDGEPKKKLRSSNESSVSNIFQLESSIKSRSTRLRSKEDVSESVTVEPRLPKKDKRKLSISPVLKEINPKDDRSKKASFTGSKKPNNEDVENRKHEVEENLCNIKKDNSKINKQKNVKPLENSPRVSVLIPPSEVIPKFEHINNWLQDTHEKSVISLSSDSSVYSPYKGNNLRPKRLKSKIPLSLSPRIKNKMKVAQVTLHEEQKLFEEIYGGDATKRLSDDVDEEFSIASSQDPVELSEKVLEKLYGTVWQRNAVLPQSEPRKGKKITSPQKKTPKTERRKQRTSIYDVFSSSSSEDRFEEFLESVRRGKLKSKQRHSGQLGTPEFINDSESGSNCSLTFYQNIISSTVKEDTKTLRLKNINGKSKANRRKLSFSSSKDDASETGKSEIKPPNEGKKTTKDTKKSNLKSRSKTKIGKDCEENKNDDFNGFTLVTPIKLKSKIIDEELSVKIKNITKPEVPTVVGKQKTSKKPTKQDEKTGTEEKLRSKYLEEDNFKVPKNLALLKTPTIAIQRDVQSSPSLSFLSSLSEMTGGLPCHPDALVYKKDFKNKREELSKKLFSLYNKEVFENKLPADMLIQWNTRMTSTSGFCYNKRIYSNNQIFRSSRIVLSTKILDRADRLRDTLIHELCHAATWIVNATSDGHGPNWRAWADKANRRFPELPVIKRCHDYAISTKYTYKCMSCGYCIGRHSKSLDVDRKRCGYCYGKFQVFVTSKMSTASATSGSDSVKTTRNPTGFALFVKENYAAIKKVNNAPHAQVMKLLSQKFAEVKISKQNNKEPVITN